MTSLFWGVFLGIAITFVVSISVVQRRKFGMDEVYDGDTILRIQGGLLVVFFVVACIVGLHQARWGDTDPSPTPTPTLPGR